MKLTHALALCAAAGLAACGDDDETTAPAAVTCSEYCTAITANCTGTNAQYGAAAPAGPGLNIACESYCTDVAFAAGTRGETSGNTLACRAQHATLAASDPATHCGHAGPVGSNPADTSVCGTPCDTYCELALERCTGANQVYASAAECQTACTALAEGPNNDTNDNTVQCRIWHLSQAIANPNVHCAHARNPSTTCTVAVP